MKHTTLLIAALLSLSACEEFANKPQHPSKYEMIGRGEVLHVKENGFILKEKDDIDFIELEGRDREIMQRLHTGDHIVLLGTRTKDKSGLISSQIEEIELANGSRVRLQ
jgi:hypothetical protein